MDLHVDLRGRRALVTGGATGIGRAISEAFIGNGAAVAIGYRSSADAAAELTARAADAPVAAIAADLTDPRQVEHLCTEAAARLGGPIDILVNNAGDVLDMRPLLEAPLSAWHDTLALDLTAAMLTSRLLAPAMRERGWGRIINISSISAHTGGGGGATAYVAAKGGLSAMTRSLAKELGPGRHHRQLRRARRDPHGHPRAHQHAGDPGGAAADHGRQAARPAHRLRRRSAVPCL